MNATARRGVCPQLSAPMETGDGLLARLVPSGATITLDAFDELCRASRAHGNGIIEITSRGSVQVRGLTAASAPMFAHEVAPLGIDSGDVIPVLVNPLGGLDFEEILNVGALADSIRRRLYEASFTSRLSPKVSVILDGGGILHLDDVVADVRLRAVIDGQGPAFHLALGGTASTATAAGAVAPNNAAECVMRLLELLSRKAFHARMRDVLSDAGSSVIADAVDDLTEAMPQPSFRKPAQAIKLHILRAGDVALGVGMPFGHSDASTLETLIAAARQAGAVGLRTAPGRALLVMGLSRDAAWEVSDQAAELGLIVDADDPRRNVVACAGSPICASGQIPARALAPVVARAVANRLGDGNIVHVSGCSKGCAHPTSAAVSVVGSNGVCDVQLKGKSARAVTIDELGGRIVAMWQEPQT